LYRLVIRTSSSSFYATDRVLSELRCADDTIHFLSQPLLSSELEVLVLVFFSQCGYQSAEINSIHWPT
jgi:hypothetical protein